MNLEFKTATAAIFAGIFLAVGTARAFDAENFSTRVEAGYWSLDGNHGFITKGNINSPIANQYAMQIDLAYGDVEDNKYLGVGGHAFWRQSQDILYGVTASYQEINNNAGNPGFYRIGAEAERYYKGIQLNWGFGYQGGDVEGTYANTSCRWFYSDNLAFSASAEAACGLWSLGAAVEYKPEFTEMPGLSFYADTTLAKDSFQTYSIGVKYYFGKKSKTLARTQRTEMLPNLLPGGINTMTKWNPKIVTPK